ENLIAVASGANAAASAESIPDALLGPATTLLMQMEVPAAETASLIARARRRGARIVLNLAPARPLDEAALRALDLLLVNEGELRTLGGDAAALAGRLGVAIVVTLGARGAVASLP